MTEHVSQPITEPGKCIFEGLCLLLRFQSQPSLFSLRFGRECYLDSDRAVTCVCPPGYAGRNCDRCQAGYEGDPLRPGDSCRPGRTRMSFSLPGQTNSSTELLAPSLREVAWIVSGCRLLRLEVNSFPSQMSNS